MAARTSPSPDVASAPLRSGAVDDERRARDLASMKRRATALLVAMTALFVVMRVSTDGDGWAGFVEAGAEAAMVGGLADWFAVTALFRHPLYLPIPHTAIIPTRKNQIGESLGGFVRDNFLAEDLLAERLREFGPAERIGRWLAEPQNASRLGSQTSSVISGVTGVMRDEDVAAGIEAVVARRLETLDLGPLLAQVVEIAIDGDHHQGLLDAGLRGLDNLLIANEETLRHRLRDESPWWVPSVIDDRVFARISQGIRNLSADILADPDHELRGHVDARTRLLAQRLRDSPEMQVRLEELKRELLDHPEVRAWLGSLWEHIKAALVSAADDPDSELRRRIDGAIAAAGQGLTEDPELAAKVDRWLEQVVRHVATQTKDEAAGLISSTVERWDAEETGRLLELQVGRDLQFIRINGTVVGGLAGIAIHAIAVVL